MNEDEPDMAVNVIFSIVETPFAKQVSTPLSSIDTQQLL
jgi:hypothetical protein